ncbi:HAMP domain-containing sensor histidine kinase [Desertivirga brevis]|uniref:HAMP domain-containing sensor histidine kinase n=1 Tax=Desertivirga brevis TaxID=2810310 RepID=UPI001A95BB2B|nr:HAMP domain-containing sensor histidine kinase [Pedobacter sp. SYSU D00873]
MRIQTKITLLYFIIATAGLILLNASIFYFVSQFNFEDFFKRLEARVRLSAQINLFQNERSGAYQDIRNRYLEKLDQERDYLIKYEKGKFARPLPLPEQFYEAIVKNGSARYNVDNEFYAGSYVKSPKGSYIVMVAAQDPYGFKELEELKKVLIITFFISVILTYVAGKVFSYYTIKPVRAIIKSVRSISANNLHLRLTELKGSDEISELVQTFNHMLTRLETSFETQNNFVSNASHELRTPLAIITSETELLLSAAGLPEKASQSAKNILAESEKLEQILTSLLGLAQTGFDGKKQNWQLIRTDELVLNVVDSVRKIDAESNIAIDFSGLPANEELLYTEGNINLLRLALSNIVLNACKYSNNQQVVVRLSAENGRIAIVVIDKGIGIPQSELQHVFEPFFRASNTTDFEGHGIGLPLTLNIIRLHKGSIGIRSEEKIGTEMQVLLPVCRKV